MVVCSNDLWLCEVSLQPILVNMVYKIQKYQKLAGTIAIKGNQLFKKTSFPGFQRYFTAILRYLSLQCSPYQAMILILMRKFRAHTDMIQLGIYPGLQKKGQDHSGPRSRMKLSCLRFQWSFLFAKEISRWVTSALPRPDFSETPKDRTLS